MVKLEDLNLDADIVLKEDGMYYELEYAASIIDGVSELPTRFILKKGKRIYKKELMG